MRAKPGVSAAPLRRVRPCEGSGCTRRAMSSISPSRTPRAACRSALEIATEPRVAVRLDRDRPQPDQVRAAVGLGIDLVAQRPQLGPQQQAAQLALPRRRGGLADLVEQPGARALEQLEHDVAREAVGDDDVDRAERHVAALDVAGEDQPRVVGQQPVGVDHEPVALALLVPVGEQADARLVHAQHAGREGGAHVRELVQLIGPRDPGVAPMSSTTIGPFQDGSGCTIAGRRTPGRRRNSSRPAASTAPVGPAETAACAVPSRTRRMHVTTEASSRSRAARAGSSSCAITPGRVHDLDLRHVAHERLEQRRRTAHEHAQVAARHRVARSRDDRVRAPVAAHRVQARR